MVIDEPEADRAAETLTGVTVRKLLPHPPAEHAVAKPDDTVLEIAALMARLRSPLVVVADGTPILGAITASNLRWSRCWWGMLVLSSKLEPRDYMPSVEWQTLLFFAGLFVSVRALAKTGVNEILATKAAAGTDGRPLLAVMLILIVSAVLSGIVDNIPHVATLSPTVLELSRDTPHPAQS